MDNEDEPKEPSRKPSSGPPASKAVRALQALQAAEAARRVAFKRQREELERAAAAETVLLRRAERERQHKQQLRAANRLGRMVLVALRRQGLSGTLLAADDLNAWSEQDKRELMALLEASKSDAGDGAGPSAGKDGPPTPDVNPDA